MRAKRPYAAAWEEANDRPYFASGASRAADEVVWRAALEAEVATAKGEHAAVVTQDMAAFFQSVDLRMLLSRAREHKFPMPLARLAVSMYTKAEIVIYQRRSCSAHHPKQRHSSGVQHGNHVGQGVLP